MVTDKCNKSSVTTLLKVPPLANPTFCHLKIHNVPWNLLDNPFEIFFVCVKKTVDFVTSMHFM